MITTLQCPVVADLTSCDIEPIHAPGAIQPYGVLIVADAKTLHVTHVSENFASSSGLRNEDAIGAALSAVIGVEPTAMLQAALSSERHSVASVMTLDLGFHRSPCRDVVVQAHAGHVFLELEIGHHPIDRHKAVSNIQSVIAELPRQTSVAEIADRTVAAVRRVTGYDRVMVYRFDAEGHGEVVAEDKRADLEPLLHYRYPASDIPAQARKLYLTQRIRIIADTDYQPVKLLTGEQAFASEALDMSYCTLRRVSPLHLEYLRNMGVGGTLAISLIHDEALWGMVVCHHQTPHSVPADVAAMCDLVGQIVALLIQQAEEREALGRTVERQAILAGIKGAVDRAPSILAGLGSVHPAMVDLMDAGGVALRLSGCVHLFGATPSATMVDLIFDDVEAVALGEVFAEDSFGRRRLDWVDLADLASGVLYLPLLNNPHDAIIWFRPQVVRTIVWGGDPGKPAADPDGRISPRKSFARWLELVRGTSLPWTRTQIRAAHDLRRVVTDGMLRHAEASLARLSSTDTLTGLANRRQLEQELHAWQAAPAISAALLFVDLDRFKTVNDSLGHAAGDALLLQVADRLQRAVPPGCLVARLGGDEFVVFLLGRVLEVAQEVAAVMLQAFEQPFDLLGRPHRVSASIGVAWSQTQTGDLLREADAAMYAAKRMGSGGAVVFQDSLHQTALTALRTEQDMFLAIQRDEFVLHYQPIVATATGATMGFEALVRWKHPERGLIPPLDFISLAEETWMIVTLGRWIMETGIAELATWRDRDLTLAINVSPRQLGSGDFAGAVRAALHRAGIEAPRVTIEVTEGALMDRAAVAQLHELRAIGCRIAIDDFGTGYSSLAYLRHLPIDIIKIDRSFVTPLGSAPGVDRFFDAIVGLARTLDLRIVAEGVETVQQLRSVKAARCDAAQGYLFSKPLGADERQSRYPGSRPVNSDGAA
ncbi:EAL domain-containing protein (plasmid) [Lichenicola cladoniae]|uniref:EAL domain-containing protein n=1 Tax=Lichenicola cladoniae TaxID=1484109 RepID=A0A6M8HY30_9PROT|nr:EAL domain-containing protein [Lichenicola cladoniae]NPD70263.1 EAL domain-containing protein [Acetobacteraceae bacterium]QKE93001.1 EAL domain-containing protein [Lichenicola cladoniae]